MPFGLYNAPATFQRTMKLVLQDFRNFCLVYIDDIVIFSKNLTEHLKHLSLVLERLRQQKLYAKRSKCTFAQDEIEYVGFIVGRGGIRPHPDKLKAVQNWPTPANPKDVRGFLGLCGFYQRFVPIFQHTA